MSHNRIQTETIEVTRSGGVDGRRFVTHAGSYAAGGGVVIGVTRHDGVKDAIVPVDIIGRLEVEASAAIAAGAAVQTASDGRAATRTGTNYIAGYALEAASAAGDIIEILRGI